MRVVFLACFFALVCTALFAQYDWEEPNYIDFLSTNDMMVYRAPEHMEITQYRSLNHVAFNLGPIGIAAEYVYMRLYDDWEGEDDVFSQQSFGLGAGLSNPDKFRLFGTYYVDQRDFANSSIDDYRISVEAAKRIHSINMYSQIMARYTYSGEDDPLYLWHLISDDNYDPEARWFSPRHKFEAKALVTSVTDPGLEQLSDRGLATFGRPLLLVDDAAVAAYIKFTHAQNRQDTLVKESKIEAMLPMNLSRYFGLDIAYDFTHIEASSESFMSRLTVSLRPSLLVWGDVRVTGLVDTRMRTYIPKESANFTDYFLNAGAIASYVLKNHALIYIQGFSTNDWDLRRDASSIENLDYSLSTGLNLRF
jgi:hypothetical protein